jgi:hypothetical protein
VQTNCCEPGKGFQSHASQSLLAFARLPVVPIGTAHLWCLGSPNLCQSLVSFRVARHRGPLFWMLCWRWRVNMSAVEVSADEWPQAVSQLASEGLAALTVVDGAAGLELRLRTLQESEIWCRLTSEQAPSSRHVWPAAASAERRLGQQFGLSFAAVSAPPAHESTAGWLRRRVLLAARNDIAWPGFKDPSDTQGAPSRRKSLPLGVTADRTAIDAGEVELR